MHTVVSLLVALSPLILVLSVPAFLVAAWVGVRNLSERRVPPSASLIFLVIGALGLLFDIVAAGFAVFDNPHGRFLDSIDWGPLAGVPTVFVVLLSVYTLGVIGAVAGWSLSGRKAQNG